LSEDALTAERRAAVAKAVKTRITELRWSVRGVKQRSGLSENTIWAVIRATGHPRKPTLVALSAVLGWDPLYLVNIADGKAAENVTIESLMHAFSKLTADMDRLTDEIRRGRSENRHPHRPDGPVEGKEGSDRHLTAVSRSPAPGRFPPGNDPRLPASAV
jgi:hypothetical protein